MDPQSIKKFLVPTAAVAALIIVVAVIIGNSDAPPKPHSDGTHATPSAKVGKAVGDASDTGMSDGMPPDANWAVVLPGGLKYTDVKEGTGDTVSNGQTVNAHYSGWLARNGAEFDSSRKGGKPIEFSLNGVIKGWQNGIPGMKVGGIRRLYIPSAMAYGPQGTQGIPPDSDLIFEVKLISFQ